jgi:hypothetical protein
VNANGMNATTTGRPRKLESVTFWSVLCAASEKSGAALPVCIVMRKLLLVENEGLRVKNTLCAASPAIGRRGSGNREAARIVQRGLVVSYAPHHARSGEDAGRRPQHPIEPESKGVNMKRFALMAALCLVSAVAQAKGVPFAVEPLQKAQELVKKDSSKHLLIFYTHER